MEQVFHFKLASLEVCAMGFPTGTMDGWPGSPSARGAHGVTEGPNKGGDRKLPRREKGLSQF